jgi:hypothetical protein
LATPKKWQIILVEGFARCAPCCCFSSQACCSRLRDVTYKPENIYVEAVPLTKSIAEDHSSQAGQLQNAIEFFKVSGTGHARGSRILTDKAGCRTKAAHIAHDEAKKLGLAVSHSGATAGNSQSDRSCSQFGNGRNGSYDKIDDEFETL